MAIIGFCFLGMGLVYFTCVFVASVSFTLRIGGRMSLSEYVVGVLSVVLLSFLWWALITSVPFTVTVG